MNLWKRIKNMFNQPPRSFVEAHRIAKSNFRYVDQPGEWGPFKARLILVHDIERRFYGDCDDFAASMCARFPDSWFLFIPPTETYNKRHVVCMYKGWVSDNNRNEVYRVEDINPDWALSYKFNKLPSNYRIIHNKENKK